MNASGVGFKVLLVVISSSASDGCIFPSLTLSKIDESDVLLEEKSRSFLAVPMGRIRDNMISNFIWTIVLRIAMKYKKF